MVKEFAYISQKGTTHRKVLVIKDSANYIEGLDLNLLPEDLANSIAETYKNYKPTSESVQIEGWDKSWNKAWRKFSKSMIV